ncbi:protein kinase [Candidatus Pacearchaeota archaeon]|nr:protein kinase [Candidatus Pacearchaeota archaeon]
MTKDESAGGENFQLIDDTAYQGMTHEELIRAGSIRDFGEITPRVINSQRFIVGRKLGQGSNGVVYAARDQRTGQYGAIKLLSHSKISQKQREHRVINDDAVITREVRFQPASYVLPSVVFEDDDKKPFIWMPQCRATLEEMMNWGSDSNPKLFRDLQMEYLGDIVHGVKELHADFDRVHGDLNPANLMDYQPAGLVNRRIVIADTGTATTVSPEEWSRSPRDNIGFIAIRAPEQFRTDSHPTTQSDVWSVGALGVRLLTGKYPTQKKLEETIDPVLAIQNMGQHEYEGLVEDSLADIPKALKPFLRSCLSYNPKNRPENGEVLQNEFNKALKKYERSKPISRIKRLCVVAGIGAALTLGAIPIMNKFVDLNSTKVALEEKLESSKNDVEFEKKGGVVSIFLTGGKDRNINTLNLNDINYYQTREFQGWLDLLEDPRTATAAFFDSRATYEAIMMANGSTKYDDIAPILVDMENSRAWEAVGKYANPAIDNWQRFPQNSAFHDPYDHARERWETLKLLYEAKKKLDEEQGEGTADRILKERREERMKNR